MTEMASGAASGVAGGPAWRAGEPAGGPFPPGGGELGALIRAKDWGSTPLGPVSAWPQSLRTAVSVALYTDFPSIVLWGPELVQLYNDSYRVLMGGKHPEGLGQRNRECWPEAWHINETIYPRVFAGETVSFKETVYPLAPFGVLEDFHLTLSYSPVLDESGGVGGVFVTVFDVTSEVRTRQERDRALAEANAERQRLYDVFMQAPAAIAVLEGPEHRFTVANPRYRELVGGRDVVGKAVADALPEIRDQGFVELLDGVRNGGEAFVASEACVRLDRRGTGELQDVYLDFVYQPLKDAAGAVFGIMAHAVEITGQVDARRSVETLAAERAAILGQIADVVVTTDVEGRVTFANAATRAIYGEMRLGMPIWDPAQPFRLLDPDGSERAVDRVTLARALRGERVVDDEWRVVRADGREVAVMGSAVPVSAADGTRIGAAMTVRDVSEQRRLQHQVEVERNRLADVFRQAPAVIAVTQGPEHTIITANSLFRQVVGAGRAVEGLPVRQALPELEGQGFYELLDGVYASGEAFVGNELLARFDRNGDGRVEDGFFNFVYHPLTDADGQVRGIMIHAVEVTDQVVARKEVELKAEELTRLTQALEQSNRELDQFAYVASHDLKAPLRGIANLTEWIQEDLGERVTGESAEHMRLLHGRVHRMEALIDGILAYSRAGRVRTAVERVDTGALVGEAVELLAPGEGARVEVEPGMPTVEAERVPLQQVFMNLIGNAVKYGGAGRDEVRVRVDWRPVRDAYEFTVSDDGPGIAPEYHDRIWGIFQTLQARDKVEGTGIGLSVVRKIVESRGGEVWVRSMPGEGAAFHFTWPRVPRTPITPTGDEP
ncbi:MAG TPA: PAS domain-containing protein [Longimicrobium sp.]|nr:PAS domain-containing protein [Longimicrobium sp.]